jgi:hypothetical protein
MGAPDRLDTLQASACNYSGVTDLQKRCATVEAFD